MLQNLVHRPRKLPILKFLKTIPVHLFICFVHLKLLVSLNLLVSADLMSILLHLVSTTTMRWYRPLFMAAMTILLHLCKVKFGCSLLLFKLFLSFQSRLRLLALFIMLLLKNKDFLHPFLVEIFYKLILSC